MEREFGIGYYLKNIAKSFEKIKEKNCLDLNLTSQQLHIIVYLANHSNEVINQKRLEKCLNLSNATISGILKRLEQKGYIERKVSFGDRRDKMISLTPKGEEIEKIGFLRLKNYEEYLLNDFSNEDRELFIKYLKMINKNMEEKFNECN